MLATIKSDKAFKPLRSAGILGLGKGMQGIMSLAFIALAARALGAENFGYLMLIHGFVYGLSQVLRFQSWQAVVRFGAKSLREGDNVKVQSLIKYTAGLDILAGIFALVFIQLIIGSAGDIFDLPPGLQTEARLYSICIFFMVLQPTPLGVLRLLDRFDLNALTAIIPSTIRLVGSAYLLMTDGGLSAFLVLWFVAAVAMRIALFILAFRELSRRGLLQGFFGFSPDQRRPEAGVFKFILSLNLSQGLLQSMTHFGVLVVGALLSPAAAGVYKIAEHFSDILAKPATKFLMPAIYPELSKLVNAGDKGLRRSMVLKTVLLCGGVAFTFFAILVLWGQPMITAIVGAEYEGAYLPMLWLCAAGLITVLSFPLEPLLSSAGRMKSMILGYAVSAVSYFLGLFILLPVYGLSGGGMALFIAVLVGGLLMFLFSRDLIGKDLSE